MKNKLPNLLNTYLLNLNKLSLEHHVNIFSLFGRETKLHLNGISYFFVEFKALEMRDSVNNYFHTMRELKKFLGGITISTKSNKGLIKKKDSRSSLTYFPILKKEIHELLPD